MGDIVEVPGVTEDELRQAVIEQVTCLCEPLKPMEPGEITTGDMVAVWNRPHASTMRALNLQVANGTMTKRKAIDQRTGRECWAYKLVS